MSRPLTKAEQHWALIVEAQCIPDEEAERVQDAVNEGCSLLAARIAVAIIRVKYDNHIGEA